jgi:hypothetical protein
VAEAGAAHPAHDDGGTGQEVTVIQLFGQARDFLRGRNRASDVTGQVAGPAELEDQLGTINFV